MSFFDKKYSIWFLLIIYVLSYFMQSWFFVDAGSITTESVQKRTHLVAVIVDKDIYQNLKSDVEWYATEYIQNQISDSKAIILPITTKNFRANEITKMLENMYFDGEKGTTSDLLGVVLLGDIPLPVVQWDGYIYPSIYPYVDFEDQQFVYDANQQYFVYNDNPNGQPEIWHGMINFGTDTNKYLSFFSKLRTYLKSPTTFVSTGIWYDDFVGMKQSFSTDTLDYYINNFVFSEDVGYHRFTNVMLDYFKDVQNSKIADLASGLTTKSDTSKTTSFDDLGSSKVPTSMILTVMKELMKTYDNLYPGVFLSRIRDNIQAASRWYKVNGSGELIDNMDSHLQKLVIKDTLSIGDITNGVSSLLVSFNDQLEGALDEQIQTNKWYMSVPVLSQYAYQNYKNDKYRRKRYCRTLNNDVYENYYFGQTTSDLLFGDQPAQEMSIYRGTYRNVDTLSGVLIDDDNFYDYTGVYTRSLGASYHVFSTQVEANRGYNLYAAAAENAVYEDQKKPVYREKYCSKWFKIFGIKLFCRKMKTEYRNEEETESPQDFAIRIWGGASPINLDSVGLTLDPQQYILPNYDYTNAQLAVYDIGGSKAITASQPEANSIKSLEKYASLIKTQDIYGSLEYPKYVKYGASASEMSGLYGTEVYTYASGGWYEFQGNKVKKTYSGFDFLTVYKGLVDYRGVSNHPYTYFIKVKGGTNPVDIVVGSSKGGKCGSKTETKSYTYALMDSRVKNVSPTADQINGYDDSPYVGRGRFLKYYTFIQTELDDVYNQILSVSTGSSSAFANIALFQTGINQDISTFVNIPVASGVSLLSSAVDAISAGKQDILSGYIENVLDGVDEFYNTADEGFLTSSAGTLSGYFEYMTEMDAINGTGTKFLSGWKSTIATTIFSIKTSYLALDGKYDALLSLYNSVNGFSYNTTALTTKKSELNNAQKDGTNNAIGCANTYKTVCDKIDALITTLSSYKTQISDLGNQEIGENGSKGNPFNDSSITFSSSSEGITQMNLVALYIKSNIPQVNVVPAPVHKDGLTQTTPDRPIDSPRNITFKGVGGDVVTFVYPNLYEVAVYTQQNKVLTLKTIPEINQAIRDYLISKSKEYNTILKTQYTKSATYYQTNKSAFDFLDKISLATPNNRTQKYLDDDYFVKLLGDTNISNLAELLYYKNLPTYSRKQQQYVDQDLSAIRSNFDLSKKIAYVVSGYLSQHADWGNVVSPSYNATGYEVAYINSDGADYIAMSGMPDFISSIKDRQEAAKTRPNTFQEDPLLAGDPTYSKTTADCGLDSSYSALLFDLNEKEGKGKMPWITALKCWWSKIPSSAKFSLSFEVGPSPEDFLKSLDTQFSNWQSSFSESQKTVAGGASFSGSLSEYWGMTLGESSTEIPNPFTVKKVVFNVPATNMIAGSSMPITFSAYDAQDQLLKESLDLFRVSVATGDGVFQGTSPLGPVSQEFSSFDATTLIYQAPQVTSPKLITVQLSGGGITQTQKIYVQPASLKVVSSSTTLYANNKLLKDIDYSLTGFDSTYSTLPVIYLELKGVDGTLLSSPAVISTKKSLVTPGVILSGVFKSARSFYIDKDKKVLAVHLMPTYTVGDDEIVIQIEGLDPVIIPIHIKGGSAYYVDLQVNKKSLGVKKAFTGTIHITDEWGNTISDTTKVKLGAMGPIDFDSKVISVNNGYSTFSMTTKQPGGTAYLYALLDGIALDSQSPGYQSLSVQDKYLPENNLNVLYLNLFGMDWGNLYGDDSGYISRLISQSEKLLAVTTMMSDPTKLKKIDVVVTPRGQVKNLTEKNVSLAIDNDRVVIQIPGEALLGVGSSKDMKLQQVESESDLISSAEKTKNSEFIFFADVSITTGLQVQDTSLVYSGETLIDLKQGLWNPGLNASISEEMVKGYTFWEVSFNGTTLGTLVFVRNDIVVEDIEVSLIDTIQYGYQQVFAEGSTNGETGIGIYDTQSEYEKQGYESIEDSNSYELGIGFTNNFKNITLWGDGQSVGESTVPYASSFLINYGDPLLKRGSNNPEVSSVGLDTGIGDQIYSEPGKSIFKVLNTDFNNDGLQDIVVVFSDGTVKLLKNYGGTEPYKNLQDLLHLADGIKDVMVGDADGNGFVDLLIRTSSEQLKVYQNQNGIFDVDGKLVCLNTNAPDGTISSDPDHISGVQQVYFEDMDKDGNIDVVTNDSVGDIKIFYGGKDSQGRGNYISTLLYTCDEDWYLRQKNNIKLVKNFGVVVDGDQYVQDSSMIHLQGRYMPDEEAAEETESTGDVAESDVPSFLSSLAGDKMTSSNIGSMVGDLSSYMYTAAYESIQNEYVSSPLQILPAYESSKTIEDIGYREIINLSGNKEITAYKKYTDINGGSLNSGDTVKITITLKSFVPTYLTYIETISGPWQIDVDESNHITSLKVENGTYDLDNIDWNVDDDQQFFADNMYLAKNASLTLSYEATYTGGPLVSIKVKDEQLVDSKNKIKQDEYLDILVSPADSCKKYRRVFFNTPSDAHKSYDEVFDNIQERLNSYMDQGTQSGEDLITSVIPKTDSSAMDQCTEEAIDAKVNTLFSNNSYGSMSASLRFLSTLKPQFLFEKKIKKKIKSKIKSDCAKIAQQQTDDIKSQLSSIPGMSSIFESWNVSNLFSDSSLGNFSINSTALDNALLPVQQKMEELANKLCQGFKLGKGGCQPPSPFNLIPFNQAFLAPGKYHLFGCTPTPPNPLTPLFTMLNSKLGGGVPVLYFPGTITTPIGPIPMIGSSFVPIVLQNYPGTDGFGITPGLPPGGGTYPSQIRMYLAPTLTMQLGVAMCFGPYQVATKIPQPFRDLGGNCVVTAIPLYKGSCGSSNGTDGEPATEELDSWMTNLAENGECTNPTSIGRASVSNSWVETTESPFIISSKGSNSTYYSNAVQGNLLGMGNISFNDKPTKKSTSSSSTSRTYDDFSFEPFKFSGGSPISLKILGSNVKGLIKSLMQEWFGRQIKYMINNLTKMTVGITLPDVTQLTQGWDQISWNESSAEISSTNKENQVDATGLKGIQKLKAVTSRQAYNNLTNTVNNPFETLEDMFQQIPLLDLHSRDVNIKVPMISSENILSYISYMKGWLKNQTKVLKQWIEAINEIMAVCGSLSASDAQNFLKYQDLEKSLINQSDADKEEKDKLLAIVEKEKIFYQQIINDGTPKIPSLTEDAVELWANTKSNFTFVGKRVIGLSKAYWIKKTLTNKQVTTELTEEEKQLLDITKENITLLSSCTNFVGGLDNFLKFFADSSKLVSSVQQNIITLEKYKEFPTQLYEWMHFVDTFMTDVSSLLSNTVFVLMNWMKVNARIYSKYVDALVLIISAIKTWQVLIDFSINRTQKCGKCSKDNYGSYSCSLSFLSPTIPILAIPPFKIPNIYIDLSHIDLGISLELPKFHFVPVNITLPQLPNIPSPPNININLGLNLNLDLGLGSLSLPDIPLLPEPPTLPELPSFIPKVDLKLPILPPAPKIPNIIPDISVTLDIAKTIANIFCILKQGIGLVAEKGVKAKVEQLTQRTRDVPFFDFFNKTTSWKKDPPLQGFDMKLDSYVQFKMSFDGFYSFLDQIASTVNNLSSSVENVSNTWISQESSAATKWVDDNIQGNLKDIDINVTPTFNLDLDLDFLGANTLTSTIEYATAQKKLLNGIAYFKKNTTDSKILDQLRILDTTIKTSASIEPATEVLLETEKQIQSVLQEKQSEIRKLAKTIKQYPKFLASIEHNDVALVSDKDIDITFKTPLFVANESTKKLIASQDSPTKAYLDTNSTLVTSYLNTLKSSTPSQLQMDTVTYNKATSYLQNVRSKIDTAYNRLGLDSVAYDSCGIPHVLSPDSSNITSSVELKNKLLAANSTTTSSTSSTSTTTAADISSYVKGIFVEKYHDTGSTMINVVRSDDYISKISDNYKVLPPLKDKKGGTMDLNRDGYLDVLMWDAHSIYVKYGKQKSIYENSKPNVYTKYYDYDSSSLFSSSWYIDSYDQLLDQVYPDDEGYVSFGDTEIRLVRPVQEVKNFKITGQDFDSIQYSWTSNESLGEESAGYLVKLNHRIDTYNDKDQPFNFLDDEFLNKRYILMLPLDTEYTGASLYLGERYYYKGKNGDKERLVSDFLSGGLYSGLILAVKYYDPTQENISLSLQEIPRNWQYAQIATLHNLGTSDQQKYILGSSWSNQIVAGRQLIADTVGPEPEITLQRPKTSEVVSTGSTHVGYVGTYYTLNADWKDNVAVSQMWIQREDTVLAYSTGNQQTGNIYLSGLYFTGNTTLDLIFGAMDFNGNKQLTPVTLSIETPEITMKDFVQISESSGQLVSELSHDIDEGMVVFQRLRNNKWLEITGSLSNSYGGFWVGPKQTIVTGSVFSIGNMVGLYDSSSNQVGSLSPSGELKIFPAYADRYKVTMDLSSSLPVVRVLDMITSSTLFSIRLPAEKLVDISLYQQKPFYDKVDLTDASFGEFTNGSCIQGIDKQCIIYIAPDGLLYIPKNYAQSLKAIYHYDMINQQVNYTIQDFQSKDIAMITVKVNVLAQ